MPKLSVIALLGVGSVLLLASSARTDDKPAGDLKQQTRDAMENGVRFLKTKQKDGNWEGQGPDLLGYNGGLTSLALLAMLEAGVDPKDKTVADGLAYLRALKPGQTYVVALQTMALLRGDRNKDKELIQRNVDWLLKALVRDKGGYGWGYKEDAKGFTDNSNTQYAVMALHAAAEKGFKIEEQVWKDLREYYRRTQLQDGGWDYQAKGRPATLTMTCAGVCGLLITNHHLKEDPGPALAKGLTRVGELFTLDVPAWHYYNLYGLARTGELSGNRLFVTKDKAHDWYRAGAEFLVKRQATDGSWKSDKPVDGHPVIATSYALMFLAKGKR